MAKNTNDLQHSWLDAMKQSLKSQLERRAPALLNAIRSIKNRHYFYRTFAQHNAEFRRLAFSGDAAVSVQTGPFEGLRYLDETVWGSITPKWLGSYEAELHDIIQQIAARCYKTVIDVGCAEGYYAVGFASILPHAKVFAFDTDFISRRQVRRLAALNNVSNRIEVHAFCSHSDLDALSDGDTLVLCDIEGFETELLDPQLAPALTRNDVLVEIHETSASSAEVERLVQTRFESSHRIQRVAAQNRDSWIERNRAKLPAEIPRSTLSEATREHRANGQVWLWMQANGA